jgi:hypothetical protein
VDCGRGRDRYRGCPLCWQRAQVSSPMEFWKQCQRAAC